MRIEGRLGQLGLTLPAPMQAPPGLVVPFAWVRVHGDRAFVSGHGALEPDGAPAGPFGRVPDVVPLDAAQASAEAALLAVLRSLADALGDLDRIEAWLTISGFVNAAPGYARTTAVLDPVSARLHDIFGPEVGAHARTAIGAVALPLDLPVVIAAEVAIR